MFWKANSPSATQIEALLEKENVTLLQLMGEDELLQECQVQNKKVVDFLTKPEILEQLVELIVTEPPAAEDMNIRFKNANLASELLACDAPSITNKLATSSNLLELLFQFLQSGKPLNPLLASFVAKVLGQLVLRKSAQDWYSYQFTCFQVIDFLKSKENFVSIMVHHVGTSAVLDLISNLINGVESDEKAVKTTIHEWLDECQLIQKLVDMLSPENDSSEHASVDQILCGIIDTKWSEPNNMDNSQTAKSILLTRLESDEVVSKLLDILLHENRSNSSVSHVINVLIALLATGKPKPSIFQAPYEEYTFDDNVENFPVVKIILNRLEQIKPLLTTPTKNFLPTSYGEEVEMLGSIRLYTCKLFTALVKTNFKEAHLRISEIDIPQILLDMFFKFSLNNLLHAHVAQLIMYFLSNSARDCVPATSPDNEEISTEESEYQSPLLKQLVEKCEIVQKLLSAFSPDSLSNEPKVHNKIAYMGHLRDIANALTSECCPHLNYLAELIKTLPEKVQEEWRDFTSTGLGELNARYQTVPIPPIQDSDMGSASDFGCSGLLEGIKVDMRKMVLDESSCKDFDDDGNANYGLFEQMVAERWMDEPTSEEFWSWTSKNTEKDFIEKDHNSSSDEDDNEFDNLRSIGEKMEEDRKLEHKQDMFLHVTEWSDVFDKRGKGAAEAFNPWPMAPAEDTSDINWASFDSSNTAKKENSFYSLVPDTVVSEGPNPSTSGGFEVNFENAFKQEDSPHIFEMKCSEASPQDISSPFIAEPDMLANQKDERPQPMDSQDSESPKSKEEDAVEEMVTEPPESMQKAVVNDASSSPKST